MKRTAIFSDVHSNLEALQAVLDDAGGDHQAESQGLLSRHCDMQASSSLAGVRSAIGAYCGLNTISA